MHKSDMLGSHKHGMITGRLKLVNTSLSKKMFSFRHCPNEGGGRVYPCPNCLALFQEVHFSIKRVYFFNHITRDDSSGAILAPASINSGLEKWKSFKYFINLYLLMQSPISEMMNSMGFHWEEMNWSILCKDRIILIHMTPVAATQSNNP